MASVILPSLLPENLFSIYPHVVWQVLAIGRHQNGVGVGPRFHGQAPRQGQLGPLEADLHQDQFEEKFFPVGPTAEIKPALLAFYMIRREEPAQDARHPLKAAGRVGRVSGDTPLATYEY